MGRLSCSRLLVMVGVGLLGSAGPIRAMMLPAPLSIPERLLQADAVVVGKVTELEKELVNASVNPRSPQKVDFQIAIIHIGN